MNLFDIRSKYQRGFITKPEYIAQMYQIHKQLFEYSMYIGDTDIAEIRIEEGSVTLTSRKTGIKMRSTHPDQRIAMMEILNFGSYEGAMLSMIFKLVESNSIIFDIGANVGWYACNIANYFPDSTVFCFEPVFATYEELKVNLALNGCENACVHNFGFSDREEVTIFYVNLEESVSASLRNISENPDIQQVPCYVKKLDDFVATNNVKQLDFIKCDVEGAELLVFQGGLMAIKKFQPIIFAEMLRKWSAKFNYHPNEIIKLLSKIGYQCFIVNGDHLCEFFNMGEDTRETNFFFLHSTKHAVQIRSLFAK